MSLTYEIDHKSPHMVISLGGHAAEDTDPKVPWSRKSKRIRRISRNLSPRMILAKKIIETRHPSSTDPRTKLRRISSVWEA